MAKFCPKCGTQVEDTQTFCPSCGVQLNGATNTVSSGPVNPEAKSKMAAGLLGLFLGAWGVHNFYLGNTSRGVIQIVVTILTCGFGGLWGFIEGIMILAGSINTDANGIPLQD